MRLLVFCEAVVLLNANLSSPVMKAGRHSGAARLLAVRVRQCHVFLVRVMPLRKAKDRWTGHRRCT